jgi:hypothetical protein
MPADEALRVALPRTPLAGAPLCMAEDDELALGEDDDASPASFFDWVAQPPASASASGTQKLRIRVFMALPLV